MNSFTSKNLLQFSIIQPSSFIPSLRSSEQLQMAPEGQLKYWDSASVNFTERRMNWTYSFLIWCHKASVAHWCVFEWFFMQQRCFTWQRNVSYFGCTHKTDVIGYVGLVLHIWRKYGILLDKYFNNDLWGWKHDSHPWPIWCRDGGGAMCSDLGSHFYFETFSSQEGCAVFQPGPNYVLTLSKA